MQSLAYRTDTGSGVNHQVFRLFDCHSELPDFTFQLVSVIKHLQTAQEKNNFLSLRPRASIVLSNGHSRFLSYWFVPFSHSLSLLTANTNTHGNKHVMTWSLSDPCSACSIVFQCNPLIMLCYLLPICGHFGLMVAIEEKQDSSSGYHEYMPFHLKKEENWRISEYYFNGKLAVLRE